MNLDDDVIKHWRRVNIAGLDGAKVEEYLESSKITPMKGKVDEYRPELIEFTKKDRKKPKKLKRLNDHLELDDFNPELERHKNQC